MTAHAILRAGLVKVLNHWVEDFKQDHLDLGVRALVLTRTHLHSFSQEMWR